MSTIASGGLRWDVTRAFLGIVYLLGAIAHVALGMLAPEVYLQFADQAVVGLYTDLWRTLVDPYLAILQPLVVVFEFGLGVALLWRGQVVNVGHFTGAVFQAGLIPSSPWGPINAVLALIYIVAIRMSHPASVLKVIRHLWRE